MELAAWAGGFDDEGPIRIRRRLTVVRVTADAERPPLCINVIHHDLPAACSGNDLLAVGREPYAPDLTSPSVPCRLPGMIGPVSFLERFSRTHAETVVAPYVLASAPRSGEVEADVLRVVLGGIEHVDIGCD